MFQHNLWHRALKLNKGIYKTTETVSDAEILKKQIREQANEILSTISVFCHRESISPSLPPTHYPPERLVSFSRAGPLPTTHFPPSSPNLHSALPPQDSRDSKFKIQNSKFKFHDYYIPESEICLLLLLDKITVLKTFLFLAKEHNFFNEEKHQILTAACVHLADSAQSELHGADIFSHPIFNSPSLPPTHYQLPTTHFPPSSPKEETLLDILNTDLNQMSDKNLSDIPAAPTHYPPERLVSFSRAGSLPTTPNLSDIPASPLNAKRYPLNASPKNTSVAVEESSQNDVFAAYSIFFPDSSVSPEIQDSKFKIQDSILPASLNASPESSPLNANRAFPENSSPEIDSSPSIRVNPRSHPRGPASLMPRQPADSKHPHSDSLSENPIRVNPRSHPRGPASLTSRQRKLYDFLLQNNKSKIGDLTRIFDQKISEKTIRRDLQILIDNSLVSQSGSRRWTCYSVKF